MLYVIGELIPEKVLTGIKISLFKMLSVIKSLNKNIIVNFIRKLVPSKMLIFSKNKLQTKPLIFYKNYTKY